MSHEHIRPSESLMVRSGKDMINVSGIFRELELLTKAATQCIIAAEMTVREEYFAQVAGGHTELEPEQATYTLEVTAVEQFVRRAYQETLEVQHDF